MEDQGTLRRLHYELIHGLVEDAACPTVSELAYRMSVTPDKVEELLHALSAIHGVVLHPCECRPWVIHPFSLTPTINWIEGQRAGWWAPCVWCALGVAALVGGEVERQLLNDLSEVYSGYFASLGNQGRTVDAFRVIERARGRLEAQALTHQRSDRTTRTES
jgi:hypothetical protein